MGRAPLTQAIVAVERGDQSLRWIGMVGDHGAGGQPIHDDTPFFLASIDKLFNATVAMKLVENGQLQLDVPVSDYLPRALTRDLHRLDGRDYSDRLTVRHLLTHTSGLADWLEDAPTHGQAFVDQVVENGDIALTLEDMTTLVRDRLRPHFPPQDLARRRPRIRYSDTNYVLLIGIIEAITGQSLPDVYEQLFLRPLGLRHTYFAGRSQPLDPTPEPMILRANGRPLSIPLLLRSIWGLYSTADDVLTFLRRFVRNEIFSNPTTLGRMQARWHRFGFPHDRAALRAPSWPIEYALGLMRFRLPRILTPLRPLPFVVGHTGSTGCWLFYCPEWDLFLAGSVEEVTAGAVPYRIVPKILRILRPEQEAARRSRTARTEAISR
jgi:CubicO group peptidase (beta-lactamase class C family)